MSSFLRVLLANHGQSGVTPFVVLYTPRTGSNLLAARLGSHPSAVCHHELFNPEEPHVSLSPGEDEPPFDPGTAAERDADPAAFLRKVYGDARGARAVGFKLCVTESPGTFWGLVLNRSVKKVFIGRRNTLETFVSALIAEREGKWIDFDPSTGRGSGGPKPDRKRPIEVDPARFRRYARKRRVYRALLKLAEALTLQRFVWTSYEEVVDPEGVHAVVRALGLPRCDDFEEKTRRQNPAPLAEKIANWDAVRAALEGTRDAWMVRAEAPETRGARASG